MRVLCLDVGKKRIGVAVSDALCITAQGVETIFVESHAKSVRRVKELCEQYRTDRVLIGLPKNMNGTEGPQAEYTRSFAQKLSDEGLEIRFHDERMTSIIAENALIEGNVRREKRKEHIDMLAACAILQSFMDSGGWRDDTIKKYFYRKEVYRMSENENLNMEADNIIELTDDEGNAFLFEHMMTLEYKGEQYICLAPAEEMEDVSDDELVIMKIAQDEATGEDVYVSVEDENELNEVFNEYLRLAEDDE